MKFFKISLALSLLCVVDAYAAIDCNQYQLTLHETKICNTPNLRKLNNQIKQIEEAYVLDAQKQIENAKNLSLKHNRLLSELSGEIPNPEIKRKLREISELIQKQYNISPQTDDLKYLTQWLSQNGINKDAQCYDFICFEKYLSQHLEQLRRYSSCEDINIDPQCEVYIYDDAATANQYASSQDESRKQKIRINKPNQCIYLFLSSVYPTEWSVSATPESKIKAIIISGKDVQTIANIPANTQIINHNSSQLLKNVTKCFYKSYSPNDILSKLKNDYKIDENNISIIQSNIIGEIKEEQDYNTSRPELPNNIEQNEKSGADDIVSLRHLLEQRKIKIMAAGDIQKAKKAGIIDARRPDFQIKDENLQFSINHDNIYLILEKGVSVPLKRATLFVPYDIAGNFLPQHSQNMYIIKATSEEVKTW